ncbi:BTB/POZ domain containing protein [Histomonas meleagridis]|uniref:BTB/POZ domain containing protein n=1 Tax=Histomonas meleagridis TaxID=135588 RepID=UPI00355ACBC8|nr:BTB/POZ domain containing protein [Histomonas meleagridis]KAH0800573.1 BTB/POZ domain containing protein [Histomonas meleagridis]
MDEITKTLPEFYHSMERIQWPEESIVRVQTNDGNQMVLHTPILKCRWQLFAEHPDEALEIIQNSSSEELRAILLYTYSDLPARRSLSPIFQKCQLNQPQSLQESTFVEDMRKLMHDSSTTDFKLITEDNCVVPVHRAILAVRSRYFRSMIITNSLEVMNGEWKSPRPISLPTMQYFVEYMYTGQIMSPRTFDLIPLVWLVKYLRLSGEKEVENIIISALTRELNDETQEEMHEAAKHWGAKCVIDVIDKYVSTRKKL